MGLGILKMYWTVLIQSQKQIPSQRIMWVLAICFIECNSFMEMIFKWLFTMREMRMPIRCYIFQFCKSKPLRGEPLWDVERGI